MPATGNKNYHPKSLSIRLHAGGFSFYVCDLQSSNLIRGEHFPLSADESLSERLTKELNADAYFNNQIESVSVLVCGPSTRLPLDEFKRDEATAFYRHLFPFTYRSRVAYNIQSQAETVELYAIPEDVEQTILRFYPNAQFYASQVMLQERLLRFDNEADTKGRRLYCCFTPEELHLYSFQHGHLSFANTFDIDTTENLLYLVLGTWKQLRFDADIDTLYLFSNDKSPLLTALHIALSSYVCNTQLLTPKECFVNATISKEKEMPLDLMALLLSRH